MNLPELLWVYKDIYPYSIKTQTYTPRGIYNSSYVTDVDIVDFIIDKNMETKELKIEVPEGFEIDKEKSSFEKIVFKKKDTKPRSWGEYCESKAGKNEIGYFIDANTDIRSCNWGLCNYEMSHTWRNVLHSNELAKSFRAFMQLMSLRQAWVDDWKPDWKEVDYKYCIIVCCNIFQVNTVQHTQSPLSFPTKEMAEDFMKCFMDLLYIAKPLL